MRIPAGSTNVSVYYYIQQDASGTSPGEPVTGLLYSNIETGGSASYARQGAARVDLTLITLASASAAHADGGFILVDDTNMPGVYRCDYPDAAFAAGVNMVICSIVVASANNAVAAPILVDIEASVAQTGDSYARLGSPAGASIAADLLVIDNFVDGLESTLTTLDARIPAALVGGRMASNAEVVGDKTGYALTSADHIVGADTLLDRDMSTGVDSGSPTVRTVRQSFRALRNKWANAAGTYSVYKENDTTVSWTSTIGTDAAAVPIVSSDPA